MQRPNFELAGNRDIFLSGLTCLFRTFVLPFILPIRTPVLPGDDPMLAYHDAPELLIVKEAALTDRVEPKRT
jgi:hypothetical protein